MREFLRQISEPALQPKNRKISSEIQEIKFSIIATSKSICNNYRPILLKAHPIHKHEQSESMLGQGCTIIGLKILQIRGGIIGPNLWKIGLFRGVRRILSRRSLELYMIYECTVV